jgi:hypothetical protein
MQNAALLDEACRALGYLQRDLGAVLGVSTRTVQRWYAAGGFLGDAEWQALARAAHPGHPDLAARLAAQGRSSLEALGLVVHPPTSPARDLQHLADGVVCVAAEAVDLSPRAIRPALVAALRRARQMGLTVEDLENALGKPEARKAGRKA